MIKLINKDIQGSVLMPIAHSDNGIESLIDSTLHKFLNVIKKLKVETKTQFLKFGNSLKGTYKNDWEQVLNNNFTEMTHASYDKDEHD